MLARAWSNSLQDIPLKYTVNCESINVRMELNTNNFGGLIKSKEGNVLFNDAFNTFFNMVKDHSDSERGNQLPPLYGLLSD